MVYQSSSYKSIRLIKKMGSNNSKPKIKPVVKPRVNPFNFYTIGRTGVGKSTLLNCLLSYNKYETQEETFTEGTSTQSVTQSIIEICDNLIYEQPANQPQDKQGIYTSHQAYLIDAPGCLDDKGEEFDLKNHANLFKKFREKPPDAIMMCTDSNDRIDQAMIKQLQFLYTSFGVEIFKRVIFVKCKTRLDSRTIDSWNMTLEDKRKTIEQGLKKQVQKVVEEKEVPEMKVVFVDASIQKYISDPKKIDKEELDIFKKEMQTLMGFLLDKDDLKIESSLLWQVNQYFKSQTTLTGGVSRSLKSDIEQACADSKSQMVQEWETKWKKASRDARQKEMKRLSMERLSENIEKSIDAVLRNQLEIDFERQDIKQISVDDCVQAINDKLNAEEITGIVAGTAGVAGAFGAFITGYFIASSTVVATETAAVGVTATATTATAVAGVATVASGAIVIVGVGAVCYGVYKGVKILSQTIDDMEKDLNKLYLKMYREDKMIKGFEDPVQFAYEAIFLKARELKDQKG